MYKVWNYNTLDFFFNFQKSFYF